MGSISFLVIATLSTIIGTVVIGIGFYVAFRLRAKQKPEKSRDDATPNGPGVYEPVFLKRYTPASAADNPAKLNQARSHKPTL